MSLFLVPRRHESCKCDRCDNRLPIDDIGRIDIRLCETCWWIEQVAQWEAGGEVHPIALPRIDQHHANLKRPGHVGKVANEFFQRYGTRSAA